MKKLYCHFHEPDTWSRVNNPPPKDSKFDYHIQKQDQADGYVQCSGCKNTICTSCIEIFFFRAENVKAAKEAWLNDPSNQVLLEFLNHKPCSGGKHSHKFLSLDPSLMPCCEGHIFLILLEEWESITSDM
jgi:hypothetical protein